MRKLACQNFLDPGPVKTLIDIMSDNVDDIDLFAGSCPSGEGLGPCLADAATCFIQHGRILACLK